MASSTFICSDTYKALKGIASNSVHAGVTSPPYNKQEKNKGWLVKNVVYDNFSDAVPEETYQKNQVKVLNELYRIIKPGGSFFYNHKVRWDKGEMYHPMDWLKKTKWTIRQEIVWDRSIAANIRGWRFWQVDERIYWLYKSKDSKIGKELASRDALLTSIWRLSVERNNSHPAPFPLSLPLRCLLSVMRNKRNGIIIDPYCGSGTTILAARMLGLNGIGIDISSKYIKDSKRRIKNIGEKDEQILLNEISKHRVTKSFRQRKKEQLFTGKYRKK